MGAGALVLLSCLAVLVSGLEQVLECGPQERFLASPITPLSSDGTIAVPGGVCAILVFCPEGLTGKQSLRLFCSQLRMSPLNWTRWVDLVGLSYSEVTILGCFLEL